MGSIGAASNIRSTLSNIQINVGFNLLDAALDPDNAAKNVGTSLLLGVAATGGKAAFQLLKRLSSKFKKACNSFDGSTLIATEFGLREIQEIQIGDYVWAYDQKTGKKSLQEVVHLLQAEGEKDLVDIHLLSGDIITTTTEHPFFVPEEQKWKNADKLTIDDVLLNLRDGKEIISDVRKHSELAIVYNLTIANDHNYYVSSSEVLSHNAGCNAFYEVLSSKLKGKLNSINSRSEAGSKFARLPGKVSITESIQLGMAFVGKDYVISTGRRGVRTFKSKDGLRQFTYPSSKNDKFTKTGYGVNFEKRSTPSGEYKSNVHLDVKR